MDRIWLKNYPVGVPADIDTTQYSSLVGLLEESFAKFRDRKAFICMDKSITYRELDEMSVALAAYLQSKGLKKGARVAIMMPNVLQNPVATAAILRAGYAVVNVNPLYTPRELEHQLKDSGAEAIFLLENFATTLEKVLTKTDVKHVIVGSMGDLLGFKGCDRQFRRPARQENGAAVLAPDRHCVQRRDRSWPPDETEQAADRPRRRRLPAIHRRHHRRFKRRHAAPSQYSRKRAAKRCVAATRIAQAADRRPAFHRVCTAALSYLRAHRVLPAGGSCGRSESLDSEIRATSPGSSRNFKNTKSTASRR